MAGYFKVRKRWINYSYLWIVAAVIFGYLVKSYEIGSGSVVLAFLARTNMVVPIITCALILVWAWFALAEFKKKGAEFFATQQLVFDNCRKDLVDSMKLRIGEVEDLANKIKALANEMEVDRVVKGQEEVKKNVRELVSANMKTIETFKNELMKRKSGGNEQRNDDKKKAAAAAASTSPPAKKPEPQGAAKQAQAPVEEGPARGVSVAAAIVAGKAGATKNQEKTARPPSTTTMPPAASRPAAHEVRDLYD